MSVRRGSTVLNANNVLLEVVRDICGGHILRQNLHFTTTVEVNPIYEYFVLFYRRINVAVVNFIGIKSSHIPFTFTTGNVIGV